MSIYAAMGESHPKLRRGTVWCVVCDRRQVVDAQACLRGGWPKCHGQTMTLDSPDERALFAAFDGVELSDAERRTLSWLSGWEQSTMRNIARMVKAARALEYSRGCEDGQRVQAMDQPPNRSGT